MGVLLRTSLLLKGILLDDTLSYARMRRPYIDINPGFSGFNLLIRTPSSLKNI
jgi:hypothetical protein